jgi:outer membrane lipoprotein-sorting protein
MVTQLKTCVSGRPGPVLLLCLFLLFSGGCARQPWTKPVNDDQAKAIRTLVEEKRAADAVCSSTLDAEVTVSMKTLMDTRSFSGFLQMKLPSSVKFVTTNPLGQAIFAFVSDGKSFRSVNTLENQFVSGGLEALAIQNDLPPQLLTGHWGIWLSDRVELSGQGVIADVRQDAAGRGVWVKIAGDAGKGAEYILINPEDRRLLARVLLDGDQDIIARIDYSDWQGEKQCAQPTGFLITSAPKGVEIIIHLSGLLTDKNFTERNFSLRPPPGYFIRLIP